MKALIRRKLENFIFQYIDKYRQRKISIDNNPYGIIIKKKAAILDPNIIKGGKNISIGENTFIGRDIWLSAIENYESQSFSPKISIGKNVAIGNYACITAINEIIIEDNCLLSEYVYISDHGHGFNPERNIRPALQDLSSKGPVKIGENTFLGFRVCVLPGVVLGKNCIVGSHSVVTKSFPDYSMIGGIPARLLKVYSFEVKDWVLVNEK